jgi:DNA-binding LytR/AlgR family response regulator
MGMKKKTRLVVQKGNEKFALKIEEIAFIYRDENVIIAVDRDAKQYLCNETISQLEESLDPSVFFRANRQYLINIQFVKGFKTYDKVKLEIRLTIATTGHQIIISQETAPFFKRWLVETN